MVPSASYLNAVINGRCGVTSNTALQLEQAIMPSSSVARPSASCRPIACYAFPTQIPASTRAPRPWLNGGEIPIYELGLDGCGRRRWAEDARFRAGGRPHSVRHSFAPRPAPRFSWRCCYEHQLSIDIVRGTLYVITQAGRGLRD